MMGFMNEMYEVLSSRQSTTLVLMWGTLNVKISRQKQLAVVAVEKIQIYDA
jgi:hypothetical protein